MIIHQAFLITTTQINNKGVSFKSHHKYINQYIYYTSKLCYININNKETNKQLLNKYYLSGDVT